MSRLIWKCRSKCFITVAKNRSGPRDRRKLQMTFVLSFTSQMGALTFSSWNLFVQLRFHFINHGRASWARDRVAGLYLAAVSSAFHRFGLLVRTQHFSFKSNSSTMVSSSCITVSWRIYMLKITFGGQLPPGNCGFCKYQFSLVTINESSTQTNNLVFLRTDYVLHKATTRF